jgi:hypothetical protein
MAKYRQLTTIITKYTSTQLFGTHLSQLERTISTTSSLFIVVFIRIRIVGSDRHHIVEATPRIA